MSCCGQGVNSATTRPSSASKLFSWSPSAFAGPHPDLVRHLVRSTALDPGGSAVGFHALPPLDAITLVELTRGRDTAPSAAAAAERFFATLGKHTEWVGDAPGLVLGRIVCQVINEAAFALGEGVGSAEDIDTGMVLGCAHPIGPLGLADLIGLDTLTAIADATYAELKDPQHAAPPLLLRMVEAGLLGRKSGRGFHDYATAPAV